MVYGRYHQASRLYGELRFVCGKVAQTHPFNEFCEISNCFLVPKPENQLCRAGKRPAQMISSRNIPSVSVLKRSCTQNARRCSAFREKCPNVFRRSKYNENSLECRLGRTVCFSDRFGGAATRKKSTPWCSWCLCSSRARL